MPLTGRPLVTSRGSKYWNSGAIPLIAPEILGDIISEIADMGIVITEDAQVLSVMVSPNSASFRRLEDLEGKDLRSGLTAESAEKFDARLAAFLERDREVRAIELNHADGRSQYEFPIRYTLHRIGPDGAILMLGRDLRPIAEMQQQLVKAQLALEKDFETQRAYDTRFRVLMEATREAFMFVSVSNGRIFEANTGAATLMSCRRDEMTETLLDSVCRPRGKGDLVGTLKSEAQSEAPSAVEVESAKDGTVLRLFPTIFRAAGDRTLLLRVEPMTDTRGTQDTLTLNLVSLFQNGPDAIVFTDAEGNVLSANEGFLDLIDAAHDVSVKGKSIADFLQRGSVDLRVLTENASRAGRMRMYSTKIVGEYISPRVVEISTTALHAGEDTVFAMVMRDTSRVETGRPDATPITDEGVRSVIELVGSATLKEIVSETTNVVERMCIETAVELTMNNRVAAAEMLGLSRQSLYVKLRKYGLINKSELND
ncbi:transcriptional regulator PpsR [Roseisalinus antarcticus]|uniref:Bacterial regulatory protein, Fis family n=1 Tax=Roseisalinus antarcticus TaxID=254357 RepID=A0A1Y5S477_9RHOB|nr:transcriptional regulator PpsR [Roseisalinus antarcticus]SLN31997.1 Bacterial regulatory protein, Fis family [Roseisalinus antarcticus]